MSEKREKVVVAMSGGVDSSVAACLLVEAGYDVLGLFMRTGVTFPEPQASACGNSMLEVDANRDSSGQIHAVSTAPSTGVASRGPGPAAEADFDRHRGCCSASDAADARYVAGMLGIPFYALNFQEEFDDLIDYFADEYARGRTPNPCVVCNDRLKFGRLVEYADAVGAKYIATGHYARVAQIESPVGNGHHMGSSVENQCYRKVLLRARDVRKDQTYVLFGLRREILDRLLFPVGDLQKSEVRRIAARYNLPNRNKPDSVEICFAPNRDYARVVRERRPEAFIEGDVVDATGRIIGRHRGIGRYTVGQRRGLGIAAGRPVYVTRLDVAGNIVTLGEGDELLSRTLIAERANFLVDPPGESFRAEVKIRYLHRAAPATVELLGNDRVHVTFDESQRAITPGQAAVFYRDEVVLGGAWIESVE